MAVKGDIVYTSDENWLLLTDPFVVDGVEVALAVQVDAGEIAPVKRIKIPS